MEEDDDDLDDTITVPRLPYVAPSLPLPSELEDTIVPELDDTIVGRRVPPALVMPELRPRFEEPSGIELAPIPDPPAEPVAEPGMSLRPPDRVIAREAALCYSYRIGRTIVWLDIESYIGRRPSSPRILSGRMPRLVRVPSPGHEVSSTHLEVRQLGSSVVVTDLHSTNGSLVFPPGGAARKLRQGESVVVTPGTLVDIGDGNVLEILPLERHVAGEAQGHVPERGRQ
jgi:hypothetical protein